MYSCPECEQLINQATEVCPYCGADQKALADTELLLAGKTPKPTKTNYKRVAVVCGVLLATLWTIAWFAVPWKLSGSKTEAEARARESSPQFNKLSAVTNRVKVAPRHPWKR